MIIGSDIANAARSWLGVRYLHQGRSRHGVDCLGLVLEVCKEVGVLSQDRDWRNYGRMPLRSYLEKEVAATCSQMTEPKVGSLIVIKWTVAAAHLGIFCGDTMIHACASRKMVVEHGYRGAWIRLTHSVWALPGVTYE